MHKLAEKIADCLKAKIEGIGIDNISGQDLVELGMWTDIVKDMICYDKDKRIVEAMDEAEDSEEAMRYIEMYEDYPMHSRKGYKGQPRDSKGRYMRRMGYEVYSMTPEMYREHEPEYYRDMDMEQGRMYYTENMMEDNMHHGMKHSESRYDKARKGYEETKAMHNSGSAEDKKKAMESLENYMKELSEDMTELISKMDSSEKNMIRNKLQMLAQKVQ